MIIASPSFNFGRMVCLRSFSFLLFKEFDWNYIVVFNAEFQMATMSSVYVKIERPNI